MFRIQCEKCTTVYRYREFRVLNTWVGRHFMYNILLDGHLEERVLANYEIRNEEIQLGTHRLKVRNLYVDVVGILRVRELYASEESEA